MRRLVLICVAVMLAVLFSMLFIACGGGGSGGSGDTIAPNAISWASTGDNLVAFTAIDVMFDEEMDPSSLVLGGDLAAESNGGSWLSISNPNDTLLISPDVTWDQGTGRTITIDAADMAGNPLPTLTLQYNSAVYYVNNSATAASDGNPGTKALPLMTIQNAISTAASIFNTAEIMVAEGTYQVDGSVPGDRITIVEGISLQGGFATDYSNYDYDTYPAIIQDISTSGGDISNPNAPVVTDSDVTSATYFNGFTIQGGAGTATAGIYLNTGSPRINSCNISGGSSSTTHCYGIRMISSDSSIRYCTIDSGDGSGEHYGLWVGGAGTSPAIAFNNVSAGTGGSSAYGIYHQVLGGTLDNNIVTGGAGPSGNNYGIYLTTGSSAQLINNTIDAGTGGNISAGLLVTVAGTTSAVNNEISAGSGNFSYGVYLDTSAGMTLERNTIFGGTAATESYGVYLNNSGETILYSNVIHGGGASSGATGVNLVGTDALVYNNTICGGSGETSTIAAILSGAGGTEFINNIIFNQDPSGNGWGIFENVSTPAVVLHNDILDINGPLYYDASGNCTGNGDLDANNTCTLTEMEGLVDMTVYGNISVDPSFADVDGADNDPLTMADNDWDLFSPPSSVATGGTDTSATILYDRDGGDRTAPVSIGAYEYDGS